MLQCLRSCKACPPAAWERGQQATASVRDAWERETLGDFKALYTARHVESHEARVFVVRFGIVTKFSAKRDGGDGGQRRSNARKNRFWGGGR